MKWKPITESGTDTVYAWASDVVGYTVAMYVIGGDRKFRAWKSGEALHDGAFDSPKPAQKVCEEHFIQRKAA